MRIPGAVGRRLARVATNAVVRRPGLWRLFRGPLRLQFDDLAPRWDAMRRGDAFEPVQTALAELPSPPARVLDLGTGTGTVALLLAERFPEAEIVGADLSPGMVAVARAKLPPALAGRVRFEQADASALPFGDGAFELVTLANMIPFFDELARVTAAGGAVVFSYSLGPATPIYVSPERLRSELGRRGFAQFADFSAGSGTAFLARRR